MEAPEPNRARSNTSQVMQAMKAGMDQVEKDVALRAEEA